jgi:hypothetical protein
MLFVKTLYNPNMKLFVGKFLTVILMLGAFVRPNAQLLGPTESPIGTITGKSISMLTQYGSPNAPFFLKVIEVDGGIFSAHDKVQVWDGTNVARNQWIVVPAGRPYGAEMAYFVINMDYDKYLDSATVNGEVKVKPYSGSLSQWWLFVPSIGGGLNLVSANSGLALTFPNGANGSALRMAPLTFSSTQRIGTVTTNSGNPFNPGISFNFPFPRTIRSAANPNMQLADLTAGSNLQNAFVGLRPRTPGITNQIWHAFFDTSNDYFRIYNSHNYYNLGSFDNVMFGGTNAVLRYPEVLPAEPQQWYALPTKYPGQHYLVHAKSGLALKVQNSNNGAFAYLWPIDGSDLERWIIDTP